LEKLNNIEALSKDAPNVNRLSPLAGKNKIGYFSCFNGHNGLNWHNRPTLKLKAVRDRKDFLPWLPHGRNSYKRIEDCAHMLCTLPDCFSQIRHFQPYTDGPHALRAAPSSVAEVETIQP
jgi:hypothetical protein